MRSWLLIGVLFLASGAYGQSASNNLWKEAQAKRDALPGLHQEFQAVRTFKTSHGTQSSQTEIFIDVSQGKWRELIQSGAGDHIRIFDGQDLFSLEAGGDEYVRTKPKAKEEAPSPGPYGGIELDWAKAKEVDRRPCGFAGTDHTCVVVDAPVKRQIWAERADQMTRLSDRIARVAIDSDTGMMVQSRIQAAIDNSRMSYVMEVTYSLKRMSYTTAVDAGLFQLPESAAREVKRLSPWDVSRIKKQLLGKPAPDLQVTDIQGNPVSLAGLRGKTILLDFWTTWCPTCREDAPSLDKLYSKYGGKDLIIIGISVNEERDVVEKFLKDHPHSFPVVLTTENEIPRPYQVGAFPTYIVIAADGTLTSAAEGDQGFGELRKFLKKAGLDTD